jgi:hypothetical protein
MIFVLPCRGIQEAAALQYWEQYTYWSYLRFLQAEDRPKEKKWKIP